MAGFEKKVEEKYDLLTFQGLDTGAYCEVSGQLILLLHILLQSFCMGSLNISLQ